VLNNRGNEHFRQLIADGKESKLLHAIAGLLIVSLLAEAAGAILCCIGSHLDPHGSVGRSKFLAGTIIIAFAGKVFFILWP